MRVSAEIGLGIKGRGRVDHNYKEWSGHDVHCNI